MKTNSPRTIAISLLLFAFLYAPIAIVIAYSFNAARFGATWTGFTTKWYVALWQNELAISAAKTTLSLAVRSTLISTVLGTMLGYALARFRFRGQRMVQHLLYLPAFLPDIVMGISLLLLYSLFRSWTGSFQLGLTTMVLAHATFQLPFVAIVVRARMADLDPALEEAARDLGANRWQTFWHVTFPLIVPGILAGAMLAFTLSLDDFVVSFFTSGPGSTTLPIYIYSSVKRGVTPEINALSSLIVLASIIGTVFVTLLQRTKTEHR